MYSDVPVIQFFSTFSKFFKEEFDESKVDSKTVFVKNLPYSTNEDEVGDFFAKAGEVKSVRLVYNSVKKHFKG